MTRAEWATKRPSLPPQPLQGQLHHQLKQRNLLQARLRRPPKHLPDVAHLLSSLPVVVELEKLRKHLPVPAKPGTS